VSEPVVIVGRLEGPTRVNGPGSRSVVYFQGCPFDCAGCFNQDLRAPEGGEPRPADEVWDELMSADPEPEGIALSGGEPLAQERAARRLLELAAAYGKTSTLYTGYSRKELEDLGLMETARHAGVAVCGRYVAGMDLPVFPFTSSKELIFFSERWGAGELASILRFEIKLSKGEARLLGFPTSHEINEFRGLLAKGPAFRRQE
jgi:anaerobic ribonucleoside-triphosphate reductase activating protein